MDNDELLDDELEPIEDEEIEELTIFENMDVGDDVLQQYFKNITNISPLSMEEEQALGRKIKLGDKAAIKTLILSNLKFVVTVANRYKNTGIPLQDLINQGNIGLIEAAKRYDADKGVKFITYAVWWIRQAIVQGLSEHLGSVRLPIKQANNLYKINIAKERLTKELNRTPTDEEISTATGLSETYIQDIVRATGSNLSLDAPMNDFDDKSFLDLLVSKEQNAEEHMFQKTLKNSIDEIVSDLDEREAQIIMKRFGLDGGNDETLEEIGSELNISRERVRQIEARALQKLRKKAIKKQLNDYLN